MPDSSARDRFALSRAAGSPGLRGCAACRRMTKGEGYEHPAIRSRAAPSPVRPRAASSGFTKTNASARSRRTRASILAYRRPAEAPKHFSFTAGPRAKRADRVILINFDRVGCIIGYIDHLFILDVLDGVVNRC